MESLHLPKELYWNLKTDPIPPPSSELFPICDSEEHWLIDEDFATDISPINKCYIAEPTISLELTSLSTSDEETGVVLELFDIKPDHWTDTKTHSPPFLGYNSFGIIIEQQPSFNTKVQNPYEFKDVISGYDTSMLSQLTPPHSPPQTSPSSYTQNLTQQNDTNVEEIIDFIIQHNQTSNLPSAASSTFTDAACQSILEYNWNNANDTTDTVLNSIPFQSEIDRGIQIVDEIVKTAAKEIPDWNENSQSSLSLSPASTISSGEDDWIPTSPSSASYTTTDSFECDGGKIVKSNLNKKRTRPYGRCPEDRKSRKKEQNKNAATRYRQKKKQEMEIVLSEEQVLTQRNDELKKILAERKQEIKYLKSLLKELYQTKYAK